jgi:acetylornithine/succinyldiaminopimelate/putrescine aminotransferase
VKQALDWDGYRTHVNPVLAEFLALTGRHQKFVHAEGMRLTSSDGQVWLDWVAGFGSLNLGHRPAAALDALRQFADDTTPTLFVEAVNPFAGALARALVSAAGPSFETCFFGNSGTEAVEAALKLAFAATGRSTVVHCEGAYHGTTLGSLSMMAPGPFRDPFSAALLRWRAVPFNDAAALRAALAPGDACALVIEPVQVESGVRRATDEFLTAARQACDDRGTLLVFDEAQTGLGRTGRLFGFQHTPVVPDVMALAKALGGGIVPVSATLMRQGLFKAAYGSYAGAEAHHSTYGGNALACRVGLAVLQAVNQTGFLADVAERGRQLAARLQRRLGAHPLVRGIRFHGLLGAIEVADVPHPWFDWAALGIDEWAGRPATGPLLLHRLHRRRHLLQACGHAWNCLRIEPPLGVDLADADALIDALAAELDWMQSHA